MAIDNNSVNVSQGPRYSRSVRRGGRRYKFLQVLAMAIVNRIYSIPIGEML